MFDLLFDTDDDFADEPTDTEDNRWKQEIAEAPSEPAVSEPFEAEIQGRFAGWSGKTVFPLDNGQVWRQRHGGRYRHTDDDQRVRIYKNLLGMWQMKVLSNGRSVPVRRID